MQRHFPSGVLRIGLGLLAAGLPSLAAAHAGHAQGGLGAGFAHPFSGMDHLMAMVGVGLLAGLAGGRATWLAPAAFLGLAGVGAGAGLSGFGGDWLEPALIASMTGLGLLLLTARRTPVALLAAASGACGFIHGLAHGLEAPVSAPGMDYVAGFLLATAALHAAGLAAVRVKMSRSADPRRMRS